MSDSTMGKASWLPVALLAAIALAVGVWFGLSQGDRGPQVLEVGPAATVLPVARALPAFSLRRHDDTPFTNANLRGHWSFLFFGYTFCPDVCPIALSTFREVKAVLGKQDGALDGVEFVFVSVDPERDTLDRLGQYVKYFDPGFVGVTGSPDVLLTLSRPMGVVYRKVDGNTPEDYLVDHSAGVFLVDPNGAFRAYFPAPHDPAAVAEAFMKIARRN
ncbi:MAG: SCO family protein [Gammaproteobacteria bacterium]|nr:SCO family protein [Gammaproteobacteria bacterium]MCP5137603.1 SCO family protein [Gammaproteobacteria bacterium]